MKFFLYKQNAFLSRGGYLWPHCCMNTSHIDHFTPQHTAFEQSAACQSVFLELLPGLIAFAFFQKFSHLNALGSKFDLDVK